MLNILSSKTKSILVSLALLTGVIILTGCDSEPPALMKAVKQFDSDEIRDRHIREMRVNHMDALIHKRDETMYKGIRTQKNSLKACINCHVPAEYNGKPLRHTDSQHFCSTCHGYVAAQLDCFQCHSDQPEKDVQISQKPNDVIHQSLSTPKSGHFSSQGSYQREQQKQTLAFNDVVLDKSKSAKQEAGETDVADKLGSTGESEGE